jgi:dipeptidase E
MRLYLSSFDLGNRPEELVALVAPARRAAIVVNALDNRPEPRAAWLSKQTDKLAGLGFTVVELDLRDYFESSSGLGTLLGDIDVAWVNGGNAFILRRAMKQSGFNMLIKSALARDEIVYAGFSAGTVVVSDSLRGLDITDDPNDVPSGYAPEVVWEGLGLVPFAIAVHFKSDHPESAAADREVAFYQTNGIPFRTLRDGEALVVNGDRQEVVGILQCES